MSIRDVETRERCRLMRHRWDEVDSNHWKASMGVPFTLLCEWCGMERRDQIGASTGRLVTRRYLAPKGYYYDGDEPRLNNDARRLLLVQTMIRDTTKRRNGQR